MRIDGYIVVNGKVKNTMVTSSIDYAYEWMEYNRHKGVEAFCSATDLHKLDTIH